MNPGIAQHYDPEIIKMMQGALEDAWDSLPVPQRAHSSKIRLATLILETVAAGERDPAQVRAKAVNRFLL